MTSNVQLEDYIKRNKNKMHNKNFLGVFPSDELPEINTHNACCIINYSPSTISDHGHWVACLYLNQPNKSPYFFDSYGFPPDRDDAVLNVETDMKDWILRHSSTGKYDYNKFDFQAYSGPNNDVCGEFACVCVVEGPPNSSVPIWNKLMTTKSAVDRDFIIRNYAGIIKPKQKLNN